MNVAISEKLKEHMLVCAGSIAARFFNHPDLVTPDDDEILIERVIDIVNSYIADPDPDPDDFYEYVKCKLAALYGDKSLS